MKKLTAEQIKRLLRDMEFQKLVENVDMGERSPLKAENGQNPFALAHENPGQSIGCVIETPDGEIRGSIEWKPKEKVRKPNLFEQQEQRDAELSLAAKPQKGRDESASSSDGTPEPSRLAEEGNFTFRSDETHEVLDVQCDVPGSTDQPIAIVHPSGYVEIPDKGCDDAIINPNASTKGRHRKRKRASQGQSTPADETPSTESDQQGHQEKSKASSHMLGCFDNPAMQRRFVDWYASYEPSIQRYCYNQCVCRGVSPTDAEDVCQEVIIKIQQRFHEGLLSLEPITSQMDWGLIHKIIHDEAIDCKRRAKKCDSTQSLDQRLSNADPEGSSLASTIADQTLASQSPIELRVRDETIEELNQAIQRLSEDQQVAIRLRYQDGLRYAEIADVMGKSPQAIKNLMPRALSKLAEVMSRTNIGT